MTDVVDLEARRKAKEPPEDIELYVCDCGSGLWRLYANGAVECVNCAGMPASLRTVICAET